MFNFRKIADFAILGQPPSGRFLAAGCSDGTLSSWSTGDWQRLGAENQPVLEGRKIWTIAVSRDGRWIAVGGYRKQIAFVAMEQDGTPSARPVQRARGVKPRGYVWSLAFSPLPGGLLLAGDGLATVLECSSSELDEWQCEKTAAYLGADEGEEASDAIRALAFSTDGTQIAIGHWQSGVEVWNAGFDRASRRAVDVGTSLGPVHSLAFFEACGRRQLAIGKGVGVLYRNGDQKRGQTKGQIYFLLGVLGFTATSLEMPRLGRVVLPNYPHHAVQRGRSNQVAALSTWSDQAIPL